MKGCTEREVNGWSVKRVHYSADPDKDPATERGRAWLVAAKRGIRDRDWRQEYEIDYRARSGQPVFPEFSELVHVIDPFIPAPECWTTYLGADPHPRTAHAFVWLSVNAEGQMVIPWSWWPQGANDEREGNNKARLTVADYAERIKASYGSPMTREPYRAVMDVAGKAFNSDEGVDYFQAYRGHDIHFLPAKRNKDLSGYDGISEALRPKPFEDGERPSLVIMRGCGDNDELIAQLRDLRFREWRGVVTDKDAPEEVEQKRRHLVDCLSYILLDQPEFIPIGNRGGSWHSIYPRLGY